MIKIKAINIHQIQKIPSIALFIKLNNFLSFVVRALNHKIYLLNKFQLFNKVLSIVNKTKQNTLLAGDCIYFLLCIWGFPGGSSGKEPTCQWRKQEMRVWSLFGKIPWRRAWQLTPVFLPRESHGQRSLAGYSPQSCRVGADRSDLPCTCALCI